MIEPADGSAFAALSFTTRADMAAQLAARALAFVSARTEVHLLDLGCGSGGVAIAAARASSNLHAVALDLSPANVAKTRALADAAGVGGQVKTVCADYVSWSGQQPFDLIISDSVMQLIECDDAVLVARLAGDLVPGGTLVATMPVISIGNMNRILIRRLWRKMPAAADRFAFQVVRRLYAGFSPDDLANRIPYLRMLPVRMWGPRLAEVFAAHGLEVVEATRWESPSLAKLEHKLIIVRRR